MLATNISNRRDFRRSIPFPANPVYNSVCGFTSQEAAMQRT
jgi:hypothetical protein